MPLAYYRLMSRIVAELSHNSEFFSIERHGRRIRIYGTTDLRVTKILKGGTE
jgi:hypothetical protein